MNANAFRHFYEYHFSENRKLWERALQLSHEQFTRPWDYSRGSVRAQIIHLMSTDEGWFTELRDAQFPEPYIAAPFDDRELVRARWDLIEQMMREYLGALHDDMLSTKPITQEEDKDLMVWQVLLHVANHGTDHRAQILRLLNDLGIETTSQDYMFYVYEHL